MGDESSFEKNEQGRDFPSKYQPHFCQMCGRQTSIHSAMQARICNDKMNFEKKIYWKKGEEELARLSMGRYEYHDAGNIAA